MYIHYYVLRLKIDEENYGYIFSFLMFSFVGSPPEIRVLVYREILNIALLAREHN